MSNLTSDTPAFKTCTKCKKSKPITDFPLARASAGGWLSHGCRQCKNAYNVQRNREKRGPSDPFIDLPSEEWRPVPGYEDRYDVSNLGRVRSWHNPRGRLDVPRLKATFAEPKDGYLCVQLYENRSGTTARVSRLLLMAFVGLPDEGMEASHLDGDRMNNSLGNLAWETRLENEQHKVEHGTRPRGETQASSKLTDDKVREIRWLRQLGFKLSELAERYGVVYTCIHKVCRRETWTHVE